MYDNLGLEPVWKDHRVVLVSDAGGLMDAEDDRNLFSRIKRCQSIQERQEKYRSMAEDELRRRLAGSSSRKLTGRG